MQQEIKTYQKKEPSVIERINEKETVYICYDFELKVMFGTPSLSQAKRYCRINDCKFSEYPPKTYTEQ